MNRIERLYALTTLLQTKRIVKGDYLAKKFNVSLRTIYRDIRALEEGGVPIGAEAGLGYYLPEGYHLPPIMFTKEEGRALLMAYKIIEKTTDPSISKSFGSAMNKVKAVLDNEKKDELQDLENKIIVNPYSYTSDEPKNMVLEQIKDAIVQAKVVEADYFSNYKGETTKRKIEPLGLVYYGNHWHLIGFCLLRKDYRDFRTDRIMKLNNLNETFDYAQHPSLREYLDKLISQTELHKIKIKLHNSIFRYISGIKHHMGLIEEEGTDKEFITLTFASMSLEYFSRWLLMMGEKVEIIEPENLKEKMKVLASTLNQHYSKLSP